uniref:Uncharacterized protein n=1 Tax=Sphenodon punctatus TaxID=8508 RepID=A0A8D0HJZ9_SPHPU
WERGSSEGPAGGAGPCPHLSSLPGLPGELTLESLLPDLSRRLALPDQLHVVKAAGKESSGLVLLSSCQSTTQRLHQFYIKHRRAGCPTATYCAVTVRIPAASEGEVRTGLKLARFGDWELVRKGLMGLPPPPPGYGGSKQ